MKILPLFLAMIAACTAFAGEAAPFQFRGVLNTGKETLFGLSTMTGDRTAWVAVGKQFEGYTVKSYDAAKSLLVFERDGKGYELRLAESQIQTAEPSASAMATVAEATALLDRMNFEKLIERTFDGQKKAMAAMTRQMAARSGSAAPSKEAEEFQAKIMDVMLEAMNPSQMKKDMAEIYAQTFTGEELRALGDFYGTPAGVALIEKQPAVQQKLQEIIMPRMAAVMPRIQQMGAEFTQQQKAKAAAAAAATAAGTADSSAASKAEAATGK